VIPEIEVEREADPPSRTSSNVRTIFASLETPVAPFAGLVETRAGAVRSLVVKAPVMKVCVTAGLAFPDASTRGPIVTVYVVDGASLDSGEYV
jgi:hypothetical protein